MSDNVPKTFRPNVTETFQVVNDEGRVLWTTWHFADAQGWHKSIGPRFGNTRIIKRKTYTAHTEWEDA